ncbi:MAG: hypothetical protein JXA25_13930 [Anaerolineales bacterium]|nr:hypothetical protein [Anaerolineales bacterium]
MKILLRSIVCLSVVVLSGCNLLKSEDTTEETHWPVASVNPESSFVVSTLRVTVPENTAGNAELGVMLFDEVTGNPYNSHTLPLEPQGSGEWSVQLTLPASTVLHYRYVRLSPSFAEELTADSKAVEYRMAYFPGNNEIADRIAGWTDAAYQGQTGRIVGRVLDATTSLPLADQLVAVAGEHTFTDGLGSFQFDQLAPGLQNILIVSTDGAYQPAQQGAIVAEDSLTPAEMSLTPAASVQVTFEVTLPEDSPTELPLRIAGNLTQFGRTFYQLNGDTTTSAVRMPELIRIDETHAILLANLYEGTDLHYKYTFGDGLWNAERDLNGYFKLRQAVLIPNLVLQDTVESWHGEQTGNISFITTQPENTGLDAVVTLQLNPFSWFYPIPMVQLDNNQWAFTLLNPLDFSLPVSYRYCLNFSCAKNNIPSSILQSGTSEFQPQDSSQVIEDQILSWGWPASEAVTPIAMPEISPRTSFETGLELLPLNHPAWSEHIRILTQTAVDMGTSAITFSPAWVADRSSPTPGIQFNPEYTPFYADLASSLQSVSASGFRTNIRPTLLCESDLDLWWQESPRDWAWWNVWFDRYRSMVLTYAHLAQDTGTDRLILGGSEVKPALPDGTLADGSDSQSPADAETRWRALIDEVRSIYSGKLAFEIVNDSGANIPVFLDSVDEILVRWETPLSDNSDAAPAELQQTAVSRVSTLVSQLATYAEKPLLISFSFPSVDGGASSCISGAESACINPVSLQSGSDIAGSPQTDLSEQMEAVHAMMLAVYRFEEIDGVYINSINPVIAQPDKSASILGKPAQELVKAWFTRIR